MKSIWRRVTAAAGSLLLLLALIAPASHAQGDGFDEVKLRYAGYLPASHVREIFLQKWMDEVTSRSGGKVTFETYRDQALLATTALLDGASRGISDISYVAAGYFPGELPLTTMQDLPFISNNTQALMMTVKQMYQEFDGLRKEFEGQNLHLLASLAVDPTILGVQERYESIDELKGKRIRAFGFVNQVLETLGAVPVALPAPDIYTSLERRVIEGYSGLPANLITPMALHEVSNFVIDFGAGTYGNVAIVMNKRKFDSLNEKTRNLLVSTFDELIGSVYIKQLSDLNKERAKALQDAGMTFVRWKKEER
ncbi:MAG: TRAP transporter substrate-binding protein DctP, partial [Gammaproteobacteria bacterium]|nr:TRAP transporter substrate-binding protein DctP [Gammaproteobacteria bacterium]